MAITLRIENLDSLPDGGPLEFTAGERGFDIGREQHLDWCLPDPSRIVSGLHAQIRFENGGYWLYDVSRNGTFINDAQARTKSPYKLANGDRLLIGDYYVRVTLTGGADQFAAEPSRSAPFSPTFQPPPETDDIWSLGQPAPSPVDRRWFAEPQHGGARPTDALDDFVDLPRPSWSEPAPPLRPPEPPRPNKPLAGQAELAANAAALSSFLATLANAAGMSSQALAGRPPEAIAEEIGFVLRIVAEQLAALLKARAAAKLMTKSGDRTMISADRNNPLKFVPTPAEALEIMFQKNRPGYLGAPDSVREGFENIKSHEAATYAAMQKALLHLMEDFSPENIEEGAGSSVLGSKKARAWDLYVERWRAIEKNDNSLLDVYHSYFREAYDAAIKKG